MSLFSIFSKTPREATSVAEALAGTVDAAPAKSKSRRSENRDAQNEQLVPEKKRARRRLIGAIAIVLAVVIGLPMVLDSEPKPLDKNIVIQIPSKDNQVSTPASSTDAKEEVVPDDVPDQTGKQRSVATVVAKDETSQSAINPAPPAVPVPASAPVTKTETAKAETRHVVDSVAQKDSSTKSKSANKTTDTPVAKTDDSARALAILSGSDTGSGSGTNAATKSAATRIVIQAGAFSTQDAVTELQNKLNSAGIKSFTQKVATSTGDKIRVRVGPFADKESADKMKQQLEKLGLKPKLITL